MKEFLLYFFVFAWGFSLFFCPLLLWANENCNFEWWMALAVIPNFYIWLLLIKSHAITYNNEI